MINDVEVTTKVGLEEVLEIFLYDDFGKDADITGGGLTCC